MIYVANKTGSAFNTHIERDYLPHVSCTDVSRCKSGNPTCAWGSMYVNRVSYMAGRAAGVN